jgi:hypothetical protein
LIAAIIPTFRHVRLRKIARACLAILAASDLVGMTACASQPRAVLLLLRGEILVMTLVGVRFLALQERRQRVSALGPAVSMTEGVTKSQD